MLIGVDFDNTLVSYDHLFLEEAADLGLAPNAGSTKQEIRDALRLWGDDGERCWQRLQARVYGRRMGEAALMPGADAFLDRCRRLAVSVVIVSHKTRYAAADTSGVDLREAALAWMRRAGFFARTGYGFATEDVFFEESRLLKIARIAKCGCTDFIDDLREVFDESTFPRLVRRHLFAPHPGDLPEGPFTAYRSWRQIADAIL